MNRRCATSTRNPAPGQPVTITNQMINALDAPVEAAREELSLGHGVSVNIHHLEGRRWNKSVNIA